MCYFASMNTLSFGKGNAKLAKDIVTFSLPAGWTCPGASACLARADRATGKLTDGATQAFRCFAASAEAMYKNVRDVRWQNFAALKGVADGDSLLFNLSLLIYEIIRNWLGFADAIPVDEYAVV